MLFKEKAKIFKEYWPRTDYPSRLVEVPTKKTQFFGSVVHVMSDNLYTKSIFFFIFDQFSFFSVVFASLWLIVYISEIRWENGKLFYTARWKHGTKQTPHQYILVTDKISCINKQTIWKWKKGREKTCFPVFLGKRERYRRKSFYNLGRRNEVLRYSCCTKLSTNGIREKDERHLFILLSFVDKREYHLVWSRRWILTSV